MHMARQDRRRVERADMTSAQRVHAPQRKRLRPLLDMIPGRRLQ